MFPSFYCLSQPEWCVLILMASTATWQLSWCWGATGTGSSAAPLPHLQSNQCGNRAACQLTYTRRAKARLWSLHNGELFSLHNSDLHLPCYLQPRAVEAEGKQLPCLSHLLRWDKQCYTYLHCTAQAALWTVSIFCMHCKFRKVNLKCAAVCASVVNVTLKEFPLLAHTSWSIYSLSVKLKTFISQKLLFFTNT